VSDIWEGKMKWSWEEYKRLILDVLMEGVNCAGLEFPECGEEVKRWYKSEFMNKVEGCVDGSKKGFAN
jgi:hypothetical protein